jgi:hypothetical protein
MKTLVNIKVPLRLKDLEWKAGIAFKALLGIEGSKRSSMTMKNAYTEFGKRGTYYFLG